jgi:hypothetical protein
MEHEMLRHLGEHCLQPVAAMPAVFLKKHAQTMQLQLVLVLLYLAAAAPCVLEGSRLDPPAHVDEPHCLPVVSLLCHPHHHCGWSAQELHLFFLQVEVHCPW